MNFNVFLKSFFFAARSKISPILCTDPIKTNLFKEIYTISLIIIERKSDWIRYTLPGIHGDLYAISECKSMDTK